MTLTFDQARASVLRETRDRVATPDAEHVNLLDAAGRILAESAVADRDYPPFPKSARDGFAARAADLPGELRVIGEVRAGTVFSGSIQGGEAVEIMTGAPMPEGADAVVMIEHATRTWDVVHIPKPQKPGDNFGAQGSEVAAGSVILKRGQRLGFAEIAALAMVGAQSVRVFRKPRVAILPTGDEIVEMGEQPGPFQIRNSNAWSLAVQVKRAGGDPQILAIARDEYKSTRHQIEEGLECDLLLLSGGVSAGKYDIVERVMADLGAQFFFDRVLIQPGQPLVFGTVNRKLFFGLPGNPASTMVTFEVFARAALELLSGASETPLPLLQARLTREFKQKPGLTRFLPATLSENGSKITPEPSQGSGDICALARSNAFLVTEPDRETWASGDLIHVLLK